MFLNQNCIKEIFNKKKCNFYSISEGKSSIFTFQLNPLNCGFKIHTHKDNAKLFNRLFILALSQVLELQKVQGAGEGSLLPHHRAPNDGLNCWF